jgi:hypothetical protein
MARVRTRIITDQEGRKIVRFELDDYLQDDHSISWPEAEVGAGEEGAGKELMQHQSRGNIKMKGVTPVQKRPFTVYDLGGGSIEIVNKQGQPARYTASDLDGIVAFIKSFRPSANQANPLWEASGESNPLEGYLRRQKLGVFSGCLVAFLHWQGRVSIAQTPKRHIAAK